MREQLDPSEAYELRKEAEAENRYRRILSQHPSCRDPDHPGCEVCESGEICEACGDETDRAGQCCSECAGDNNG